jgi:hypothetical protein
MKSTFKKAALMPYTFVLMNWAVVAGLYQFCRGYHGVWEPAGSKAFGARAH